MPPLARHRGAATTLLVIAGTAMVALLPAESAPPSSPGGKAKGKVCSGLLRPLTRDYFPRGRRLTRTNALPSVKMFPSTNGRSCSPWTRLRDFRRCGNDHSGVYFDKYIEPFSLETVRVGLEGLAVSSRLDSEDSDHSMFTTPVARKPQDFGLYRIAKEPSTSSQEKWYRVWEALVKYREIHGNLLIPHKFVIPEDSQWPSDLHKLKLGQKVRNIRAVGLHVKNFPNRIEMLNEIGFVWDDNEFRFRQTLKALQTYKTIHKTLAIPIDFVIPAEEPWEPICWGVPLGERVHNIRAHDLHIKSHPNRRKILDEMGFIWNDDSYRFKQFLEALTIFKEIYGHLRVRQDFECGETDKEFHGKRWPSRLRGYKLGDRVRSLRTTQTWIKDDPYRQQLLQKIGFIFRPREEGFERFFAHLEHFRSIHGHCNVPRTYIVPSLEVLRETVSEESENDSAPSGGLKPAHGKERPEEVKRPRGRARIVPSRDYASWLKFREEECSSIKDGSPVDSEMDKEAMKLVAEYQLGPRLHRIRGRYDSLSEEQKNRLKGIGFVLSMKDSQFQAFVEMLEKYKEIHGNLQISRTFVTPSNGNYNDSSVEQQWPRHLQGIRLGERAHKVKYSGLYLKNRPDRQERLNAIGFEVSARTRTQSISGVELELQPHQQ